MYSPANHDPAFTHPIPACVAAAHVPAPTPAAPNPKAPSPAVIAKGAAMPATAIVATMFTCKLRNSEVGTGFSDGCSLFSDGKQTKRSD